MFDDGEKFGLWPDTHHHVYADGWLENFLTVLESNKRLDRHCSRISDYLTAHVPQGRVYLPTASYSEMGGMDAACRRPGSACRIRAACHSQPRTKKPAKRFLRGGFWRSFLTKYDESNNIHKKCSACRTKFTKRRDVSAELCKAAR